MSVKYITSSAEFFQYLQNQNYKYTCVNYTAKWCGPCQMIKPYVDELSRNFSHVQFLRVDVDELPEVSNWAFVRGLPSFVVYKNGQKVSEVVGADRTSLFGMISKLF